MRRTPESNLTLRRACVGAAIAAFSVVLGACGSDMSSSGSGRATTPTTAVGSDSEVRLELVAFKPSTLEVATGTTVTWHQDDPGSHTVTSGTVDQGTGGVTATPDGRFDSGELVTDETFELGFAESGTYPYYCQIHPATMRGEIRVR